LWIIATQQNEQNRKEDGSECKKNIKQWKWKKTEKIAQVAEKCNEVANKTEDKKQTRLLFNWHLVLKWVK
jgi:hypothetical protein